TFVGGNDNDYIWNMCIDSNANVYVTGSTSSSSQFPLTAGFKTNLTGSSDAFVTKVNSAGGLMYSTYLGGNDYEYGFAVAVDNVAPTPNIYVTGYTASTNLPTPVGSYQKNLAGGVDAYAYKINPTLVGAAQVVWCSYLGGTGSEAGYGINA